jgi:hypothetical protein
LTKPTPKNLPASVRQKLANLARGRNVDFGLILVKYGLERILFRLSRSRHRDIFILKARCSLSCGRNNAIVQHEMLISSS